MRFLARLLIFLLALLTIYFSQLAKAVYAEGEFETDYDVTHTIDESGQTSATYNITLKNSTPNYYADKFELKIGSTKVTEVTARDSTGELQTEVRFENNVTTISTKFTQRVIGLGKTLSWTLNYKTNEVAIKSGQIWEVSIPKIADTKGTATYDLDVIVPKSLGPNAYAIPQAKGQTETTRDYILNFEKDQLTKSGVALGFGEKQVFSLNLAYYLENTNVTSQVMELTLPPDNNYQKVVLTKIEPPPMDVTVDRDGNFLAKYKLKPKEKIDVNVTGYAEVFSKPFTKIVKSLTNEEKELYTQPQGYWEVDNAQIKEKAQELKTAEAIYEYITKNYKYNTKRLIEGTLERKGAAAAINDRENLVCTEFTDLFIALARAAKIPAREVEGYAYTQNDRLRPLSLGLYNGDVLHAWPEYWDDDRGWVQIDPTWGTTSGGLDYFNKMDFNHITFVQRGASSTQPYPAGAYKSKNTASQKTVYVQFAQELPNTTQEAQITIEAPKRTISSLPLRLKITVSNISSTSIIAEKLKILVENIKTENPREEEITVLPPYAKKTFEINIPTTGLLNSQLVAVTASFANASAQKNIQVEPFYMLAIDPVFLLSLIAIITITILGLRFYKKHHTFPKIKLKNTQ